MSVNLIGSIVEIFGYYKFNQPKKLPHVLGIFAFGVEASPTSITKAFCNT